MLDDRTLAHIRRELQQLERLLAEYHELIEKSRTTEPTLVEYTALGAVLHSFYNGIENIFQTIGKRVDGGIPTGESWHKDLLLQMGRKTESRTPVISQTTVERIQPYLGFRHVARHAYTFVLEWGKMQKLVWELRSVWLAVQADVESFMEVS
ncbi:MAG: hypothetical protein QGG64_07745 [Candidatus Latescibacteria bacterium]|jgi:hypothetical protein|nr:hypothetical protein [Candidatus Latescibacterota bacterium]